MIAFGLRFERVGNFVDVEVTAVDLTSRIVVSAAIDNEDELAAARTAALEAIGRLAEHRHVLREWDAAVEANERPVDAGAN